MLLIPVLLNAQPTDSLVVAKLVDSLVLASRNLSNAREFDKAMDLNIRAENLALEMLGRVSVSYGKASFNHGRIYNLKADYQNAEKWYIISREIQELTIGKMHPDYASTLNNLGVLYLKIGLKEKVEPFYLEAMSIREKIFGVEHPDFISSINNLAIYYKDIGKPEQAEPLYLKAMSLREKVLGVEHPDYATSLANLAVLYLETGRYELAEPKLKQATSIWKRALGEKHPFYVSGLNNLAVLYMETGRYELAEPIYLESKGIYEKAEAKGDPNYAECLNNFANLHWKLGNYSKVEPNYKAALANIEVGLGKEHPDFLRYLNNLAIYYTAIGDYEKAESVYLEVINIREKSLGREHLDIASSLGNLAILYDNNKQSDKALPLALEAKNILEKNGDLSSAIYTMQLVNLALFYLKSGELKKAESLAVKAAQIYETTVGKLHPDYANCLHKLAKIKRSLGQPGSAEKLFDEALAIYAKSLGKATADYTECLYDLVSLHQSTGQYEKAWQLGVELSNLSKTVLLRGVYFMPELELSKFQGLFSKNELQLLSLVPTDESSAAGIVGACYDNSLFNKGFLLQAVSQVRRLALADTSLAANTDLLKSYQRRLAAEYAKPASERQGLKDLETMANDLEKSLTRQVANQGLSMQQVTWQQVQSKLKLGEVAIEFVNYQISNKSQPDSTMYAALLLKPGMAQPAFLPLISAKSLDSIMASNGQRKADYVNSLYAVAERGAKPIGKPEKTLFEMLWQPLEAMLNTSGAATSRGGRTTVYFSPVGLLHRLNLAAIPVNEDEILGDRYRLIELGSTRQLALPNIAPFANKDALFFGGIQYDVDGLALNIERDPDEAYDAKRGQVSTEDIDPSLRGNTWSYLKWTVQEVDGISAILTDNDYSSSVLKGNDATETAFKQLGVVGTSPKVLHVSTHGYFFPDPAPQPSIGEAGAGRALGAEHETVFKTSELPMIRSGLIMAGANYAWENGRPMSPGMDDGILTAYEISQMNLSNTELVVLSACETGLGDIQGNEGVYGLQRAFKIAGAKYLVMSLWQVPDFQTQELMTTFYTKWLKNKMPLPDAFHAAQKDMKDKYQNPFFWAGFVLVE